MGQLRIVLPPHWARTLTLVILVLSLSGTGSAQEYPADLREFVTAWYSHGVPYRQAKAFGPRALPQLAAMLDDTSLQEHWGKVIYTMGCIGDSAAVEPLMKFLRRPEREISIWEFRAVLGVLPAIGLVAQNGDPKLLKILTDFSQVDHWQEEGLQFGYRHYRDAALAEVLGRVAIQGLGMSGSTAALSYLRGMSQDPKLRPDWRDNVDEAIELNEKLHELGPDRLWGEGAER